MHFSAIVSLVMGSAVAASALEGPRHHQESCQHDSCLRDMIRSSVGAASFCATYTAYPTSTTLPKWIRKCSGHSTRISSACSCIATAVRVSVQASSTSGLTTSTLSTAIATSSISVSSTETSTSSDALTVTTSSPAPSISSAAVSSTSSATASSTFSSSTSSISLISSSLTISTPTTTTALLARTIPPVGAIIVDNSPSPVPNSYQTMQQGVNALSLTSTSPQSLFIYPGTYYEQVYIPPLNSNLTIQGWTMDRSSYQGNAVTITYNLALLNTTTDDLTATIRSWNPNTKFYNLNIDNTFSHVSHNGQNLALSAHTGNQGYYGVQLQGYQDTLLANVGNQLYAKSLITGAIDFIFGQSATAWFENVDIRTLAPGSITASGRGSASDPSWYVISNSNVAAMNASMKAGKNFLGRPWFSFARVAFQNTYLSSAISPAGWSVWSTSANGSTNIQNVTFAEYGNYGPGSVSQEGPRANFSSQLSVPLAIEDILGANYRDEWWVDMNYM